MFNLKAFLLLSLLLFPTQGQCGRLCLEIWEDEVHGHTFSRVYHVLGDFFTQNKSTIKALKDERFFREDNYQTPSTNAQQALSLIRTDQLSTVAKDYGSQRGLIKLQSHLLELYTTLHKTKKASDLNDKDFLSLKLYTAGLWKIVTALQNLI